MTRSEANNRWVLEGVLPMEDGSMPTRVTGPLVPFGEAIEVVPLSALEEAEAAQRKREYRVNSPFGIHGPFTDHEEAVRLHRVCAKNTDREKFRAPRIESREVGPWEDDEYDD